MIEYSFEDGKYTVIQNGGQLSALRYGEKWRDLTGDKLIGAMVSEIESLRAELTKSNNAIDLAIQQADDMVAGRDAAVADARRLAQENTDLITTLRLKARRKDDFDPSMEILKL